MTIDGKRILVTGGTGSLGQRVVRRLLDGVLGRPAKVTVLSRDEAKQHDMRLRFLHRTAATDDVIYAARAGPAGLPHRRRARLRDAARSGARHAISSSTPPP